MTTNNENNINKENKLLNNITVITKLIITIGAVTIGIMNLVVFPLIDVIFPSAHLVSNVTPVIQGMLSALIH